METLTKFLQEEWFWAMMQFFIISLTMLLIYFQVKVQTATHIVQTLSVINSRWNSESMMLARHKVCSDWLNDTHNFDGVDEYVAEYMEELGIYIRINAVPDKTMWSAQSWYIEHYFCMFREGIINMRKIYKEDTLYKNFEDLYKNMQKVSRDYEVPNFERGVDELNRFAKTEVLLTKEFLKLKNLMEAAKIPLPNVETIAKKGVKGKI